MAKSKEATQAGAPVEAPKRAKKADILIEGTVLSIDFTDAGAVSVDASSLSAEVQQNLMLHGLKQKVCDSFSGTRGQEAEEIAKRVIEQLAAGNWTVARSSGEGTPRVTLLAEAIAAISGQDLAEVTAKLSTMAESDEGKAQLKLLRNDSAVKQSIAKIKLDRASKEAKGATGIDIASVMG